MQCVILAGGRGTRMEPYTVQVAKALIPVAGKPFIDYQLAHLSRTGVSDIVLCIGYKGQQIRDHVQDGKPWKLRVRYIDEGERLQGTGGALTLALKSGVLEPGFLMTYGDAFLPIDFSGVWRYFEERPEPILMTVYKNANRWGKSNVVFDGSKVMLYDKGARSGAVPGMDYLDYGVSGLRRKVLEGLPEGPFDLADLCKKLSIQGDIAGMEITTRFYEVGSPDGLKDFSHYLQSLKQSGKEL